MTRKIVWESYHIEENLDDFVSDDFFDDEDDIIISAPTERLYQTPFGWVNLNQKLNPFAEHKLWKMYTTINIDQQVKNIIESIDGVEVFTPITRYMCIIGIGKLFDSPTVRLEIEDRLEVDKEQCDEIENLITVLNQYDYWGILSLPNGNHASFYTDDLDDFEQTMSTYEEASDLSGGILYSSENHNDQKNRQ